MFCARERVAGRVVGVTSGIGVIVKPRRRSRAEADTFSIGLDFVVVAEGECEMMEGVMPWVSCPDWFTCAEADGPGSVTETESSRAGREKELVTAPVPPEGCRECVREGGEVEGDIDGGDDDGVDGPATDPLLSAL